MFGDYLAALYYDLYCLLFLPAGVGLLSAALSARWWAGLIPGPLILPFLFGDMDRLLGSAIAFGVSGLAVLPVALVGRVPGTSKLTPVARWFSLVVGGIALALGIWALMALRHLHLTFIGGIRT